jgi:hypothetical protein
MTGAIPPLPIYAFMTCIRTNLPFYNNNKSKGKFTLEQAMKAQRGRRGIAALFL